MSERAYPWTFFTACGRYVVGLSGAGGHVAGGPGGRKCLTLRERRLGVHLVGAGGGLLPDPLPGGHDRWVACLERRREGGREGGGQGRR